MADLNEVARTISSGELDDHLVQVITLCNNRIRVAREQRGAAFQVGDRVRLTNIKPKYLDGVTGVIKEALPAAQVRIEVDEFYRFSINPKYLGEDGKAIRVSRSCLLEAETVGG